MYLSVWYDSRNNYRFPAGIRDFLFCKAFRPPVGTIQHPIQWTHRALLPGAPGWTLNSPCAKVKSKWLYSSTSPYISTACTETKSPLILTDVRLVTSASLMGFIHSSNSVWRNIFFLWTHVQKWILPLQWVFQNMKYILHDARDKILIFFKVCTTLFLPKDQILERTFLGLSFHQQISMLHPYHFYSSLGLVLHKIPMITEY